MACSCNCDHNYMCVAIHIPTCVTMCTIPTSIPRISFIFVIFCGYNCFWQLVEGDDLECTYMWHNNITEAYGMNIIVIGFVKMCIVYFNFKVSQNLVGMICKP